MIVPAANLSPPRRGIGLLPTALTLGNVFFGFLSILKTMEGHHGQAATFLIAALVLDKLDGALARATRTASDFGRELDSLADVTSFGVAPAVLSLSWGLAGLGRIGWAAAFLFLTCGAIRLARFNVLAAADRKFFVGLPIPMAAAVPVTIVLMHSRWWPGSGPLERGLLAWAFLAVVVVVALLMVSRFRYHSFKEVHFGRQRRLLVVLSLAVLMAILVAWPGPVLVALAIAYAAHGPLWPLVASARRRSRPGPPVEAA